MTLSSAQRTLLDQQLMRRARLFRVIRSDGTVLTFAEGNSTIEFRGETYTPVGGVDGSDATRSIGVSDAEHDVRGILDSDSITEADLKSGLYRGAQIWEYHIDPRVPEAGALLTEFYTITSMTWGAAGWTAECIGRTRRLTQEVGKRWSRGCWWKLGENFGQSGLAGCKVDVDSLKSSNVDVDTVVTRASFELDPANLSGSPADDYFNEGELTWLTGDNAGTTSIVAKWVSSTNMIYLALPPRATILATDTFDVAPGCDRTFAVCGSRFSNTDNYGGSPFMRGSDEAMRGVSS